MKDVRLGSLRDSWRTIRTKRLLGKLEEGRGNRKETEKEKMNGTFNISSCAAQAAVCQPSLSPAALVPILYPGCSPGICLCQWHTSRSVVRGSARRQLVRAHAKRPEQFFKHNFFDISSRLSGTHGRARDAPDLRLSLACGHNASHRLGRTAGRGQNQHLPPLISIRPIFIIRPKGDVDTLADILLSDGNSGISNEWRPLVKSLPRFRPPPAARDSHWATL
jgi:hypothetical protein